MPCPSHDVVEVVLEKHLSILVLGLEIATSDGHDALVGSVVYVAGRGGPLGDAFDMVGHDPSMLEIPARSHTLNRVHPTTTASLKHLENKLTPLPCPYRHLDLGIDSARHRLRC